MAVTASDLLEPAGDLSPALFPSLDSDGLTTLLDGYLADAATLIPSTIVGAAYDGAATAWAYHRAYRSVALRLSRDPATAAVEGEGSSTITGEQIRTFKEEAARWGKDFDDRIGMATDPGTLAEQSSQSIANSFTW